MTTQPPKTAYEPDSITRAKENARSVYGRLTMRHNRKNIYAGRPSPAGSKNKIKALFDIFADPPPEFSPAPLVFLNDEMDVAVIGEILGELRQKGFKAAALAARSGLTVPFAGTVYWERLAAIVGKAKELSLSVWLTDDYNWPSGTAAGRVLTERPDFSARGISFRTGKRALADERIIGTYSLKGGTISFLGKDPRGKKSLIASVEPMPAATFAQTAAPWITDARGGALDIMNPDAVGHFVGIVYGGFEEHLKDYFGNTIVGVLSLAPQNRCPFPWTERLSSLFTKRFGYDLIPHLPSLITDAGDYLRVRVDYYSLIGHLTADYYRAIGAWAHKHRLAFSGLIGAQGFIEGISQTQGSPFAPFFPMDIPGTSDHGDELDYPSEDRPWLPERFTPKIASSVSRAKKGGRTLYSIREGTGWGAGPSALKRSIDRAASLGANLFVPQGIYCSASGLRKRDFPPSYYHQPYWEDFKVMADYVSRLSVMTSVGKRITDILVLFPLTSLWANTIGMGRLTAEGREVVRGLEEVVGGLTCDQRDFDFLFEEEVDSGLAKIADGAVSIGDARYSVIIIPRTTHITPTIYSFIARAKEAGIPVIFVGRYPSLLGTQESPSFETDVTLFKDAAGLIHHLDHTLGRRLSIDGADSDRFIHQSRSWCGADIYFLSYVGDEPFSGRLTLTGVGNPESWDLEKGRRHIITDFEASPGGLTFPIRFDPGQSRLYVIHTDYSDTTLGLPFLPERKIGELFFPGRWEVSYRGDNMFRIDGFRLIKSSLSDTFPPVRELFRDRRFTIVTKVKIGAVRALVESIGRVWWMKKKIGYYSFSSLRREMPFAFLAARLLGLSLTGQGYYQKLALIGDAARYMGISLMGSVPPDGARYEIEADLVLGHIPKRAYLVWEETDQPIEISVNGRHISDRGEQFFLWDRANRKADVSGLLRWGPNRITVTSRQPSFATMVPALHRVEPVVLTGDFDVNFDMIIPRKGAVSHLSWGSKGTGSYSGTVTYRRRFRLPSRYVGKRGVLDLVDVRETARVVVNGRDLGVRLWPPYRFDLAASLVAGENVIEISVSNTAENLLGTPIPSGVMADPKIVFFEPR